MENHTLKSIYKEIHFNDPNRAVIHSVEDLSMKDLSTAAEFISSTTTKSRKQQTQLTKDTGYCFSHMCEAIIELAKHHLDKNDTLEKKFGKLRQGSGRIYFIMVQQIFEEIAINKTKLLLACWC